MLLEIVDVLIIAAAVGFIVECEVVVSFLYCCEYSCSLVWD